ncbi:hypothetical protein KIPB_009352, partial [Kipferlia bialata]|eukprot:g9352.t1
MSEADSDIKGPLAKRITPDPVEKCRADIEALITPFCGRHSLGHLAEIYRPSPSPSHDDPPTVCSVCEGVVDILHSVCEGRGDLTLSQRQEILEAVPGWIHYLSQGQGSQIASIVRGLIWHPSFTLVLRECCDSVSLETEGDTYTEGEREVLQSSRSRLLSVCSDVGERLRPVWESVNEMLSNPDRRTQKAMWTNRYIGPPWAEDRERRERLRGEVSYLSACLSGLPMHTDEVPLSYVPSIEMQHEASVLMLARSLREHCVSKRERYATMYSNIVPDPEFWYCLGQMKECPGMEGGRHAHGVLIYLAPTTPHSLYQSYRGRMTSLYQSTADPEYVFDSYESHVNRIPRKQLVHSEACVVGLGDGRVMYIQRRHCRVVGVVGYASLNGLCAEAGEDLGTSIAHPLSLVEIPGVYNPF